MCQFMQCKIEKNGTNHTAPHPTVRAVVSHDILINKLVSHNKQCGILITTITMIITQSILLEKWESEQAYNGEAEMNAGHQIWISNKRTIKERSQIDWMYNLMLSDSNGAYPILIMLSHIPMLSAVCCTIIGNDYALFQCDEEGVCMRSIRLLT